MPSCEVYANNNEIACKAGDGKVIATFPDVCLSPPSPPAGPIPVPYPNTSFSKDMKEGSKTVKIKNKEVMLKDKSFYKTSPLGDEAATKSLGAGVISHSITGKTYFVAWSMDVKIEGKNVDRHIDLTTSNHASLVPNASIPWANMSSQQIVQWEEENKLCACCNGPIHESQKGAKVVSEEEWYGLNESIPDDPPAPNPQNKNIYKQWEKHCKNLKEAKKARSIRERFVKEARRKNCLAPPPCNVYRIITSDQNAKAGKEWGDYAPQYKKEKHVAKVKGGDYAKVNHLTPKSAGGCPIGDNNLKADKTNISSDATMSKECLEYDDILTPMQSKVFERHQKGWPNYEFNPQKNF